MANYQQDSAHTGNRCRWPPLHLKRASGSTKATLVFPTTMSITSLVDFPPSLLVAGAFCVGISTWLLVRRLRRLPFPPGPSPDPVIGNLRQMGSGNLEFVFEKWGKEYGQFSSWHGGRESTFKAFLNLPSQDRSITHRCLDSTS